MRVEKTEVRKETFVNVGNGAEGIIEFSAPYLCDVTIEGNADLLFHRWNVESVDEKGRAAKGSKGKKSDNIESYVWRDEKKNLCLPGEYLRQSLIHAAKFRQDPRSPRKSAMDLTKAGVLCLTPLASLNVRDWDFVDRRRVTIQRAGINRERPGLRAGWKATFRFSVVLPEYINSDFLHDLITQAGRLIGVGDFRPSYGRFHVVSFEIVSFDK